MKKLLMGVVILSLSTSLAYAGDKELCLDLIRVFDTKAQILKMKPIDVIEYYRDTDIRKKRVDSLISAACIDIVSKECVDAVNTWGSYSTLTKKRLNKIKSFSLESEATYYKIKTTLYNYVCATKKDKAVTVVDN